mmetsp:Transcript_20045/g.65322  ORF Transcript_20045/g.65322 Transcript_20045/m.65322 type:complete len:165 (-) Transcript_20045:37-531(-)
MSEERDASSHDSVAEKLSLVPPALARAFDIQLSYSEEEPTHSSRDENAPEFLGRLGGSCEATTTRGDDERMKRHRSEGVKVEGSHSGFASAASASKGGFKRPRLVWTPQLHSRFVDAVNHLGVETAVPKTIMQLMNVDGLTRENVASHLQKYRLYLRRLNAAAA